jgi:tetratricopeptide (TPR) repeat protein
MSQSQNPAVPQQVAPLLALATQFLRAGRPADAIAPLRDAAQLQPSDPIIQHDLGLACLEVGHIPDAIAALQRAVASNPRYSDAYFRLGIALEKSGDIRGAIVAYDRATELLPSLTEAWYRAGALVYTLGHRDEAIGCFRRAAATGGKTSFGRLDYISHSNVWSTSAIFIEEDDAQNGVDHVDGHRSPGYIVSPYAVQNGPTDHTYYTQVNMTRTIEQILGLPPMNQFDLVASPMGTAFVKGVPPASNFEPWTHVPNLVPLDQGVTASAPDTTDSPKAKALRKAWLRKKAAIFSGKLTRPDSEDPDTVNHLNWYMSTGFTRPYPGEKTVRPPSEFNKPAPAGEDADD